MRVLIVVVTLVSMAGCEFPATKMVPVAPTDARPEKQPAPTSTNEAAPRPLLTADACPHVWG